MTLFSDYWCFALLIFYPYNYWSMFLYISAVNDPLLPHFYHYIPCLFNHFHGTFSQGILLPSRKMVKYLALGMNYFLLPWRPAIWPYFPLGQGVDALFEHLPCLSLILCKVFHVFFDFDKECILLDCIQIQSFYIFCMR